MPLSEHEQRLLEQIERALYAEDPKFASTVRGGRMRKPTRRRRVQGVALFVVGLIMLVVGVVIQSVQSGGGGMVALIVLSVLGFVVMLGGSVLAVTSTGKGPAGSAPSAEAEPEKHGFTGRMEERFRRRFEQE
jgi:hypothetical protein